MLETYETQDDVLAVTVSGKITGGELAEMMERLEKALASHDMVHVFVETRSLDGIEIADLAAHVRRALPMFGQLGRFGRVGVVADQAWVRAATRLESAVLPDISYRVFEPEQRDEALAWVQEGSVA